MPFEPQELIVHVNDVPWSPMGEGSWGKILRACPETGAWTIFFKQEAGSFAPPHKHLAAADFYVLEGCIEYRGGVARGGDFAREPLNAVHEKTVFSEETLYLFTSYGPMAMYGPDGSIAGIFDAEGLQALIDARDKA
jgi:anti-sigma factor ChrR (cupin superfamily)